MRDKITTIYFLCMLVVLFLIFSGAFAHAHDTHLSDVQGDLCKITAGPSYVDGIGAVMQTTCDDGKVGWWLLYKDVDLTHGGVHVMPLTRKQAQKLLTIEVMREVQ